jgi:calcineurin-like phosphoesterase family protein
MNIFFSSDHHFFHQNILKFCPNRNYSSVEEMNIDYINLWNKTVNPEDTVFYLGDFSMALRPVEVFTSLLNGKKILVHGNHDWTHPSHKKSSKKESQLQLIEKYKSFGWTDVLDSELLTLQGIDFYLNHLPYREADNSHDTYTKRYTEFYPLEKDLNLPILCGHVHQAWKFKITKEGQICINVGVDVWDGKPVSSDDIVKLYKELIAKGVNL